jgi:hypothetical protein
MEPSMRRLEMIGFLAFAAVSGCASMKAASPNAGPDAAQGAVPPVSGPPSMPPAPPAASPSQPDSADHGSHQGSATAKAPGAAAIPPPPPSSIATSSSPAAAKSSADTRPVKQAGAAAAHTRPPVLPPSPSSPASPPAATSSPALNLSDLEQRLRDTRAIGVFTKLSLKNQVDDLLNAFRALYRGPNKHPPVELRQRYDQLLLKVLTLLQDGDPPLAAEIASSREAIWSILADPDKFAKI